MDRRTILAVVLSLTIYYTWMMVRGPELSPPEPTATDTPVPAEVMPAPTPTPTPAPTDAPVRDLDFSGCGVDGMVNTEGGGLRNAVLAGAEGPYQMTPVYSWVIGLFTGGEGGWHPYGEEIPPEYVVGVDAHALVAGSGNPAAPPRRYEVLREGAEGIELRSVGTDGVEVTQTYTPSQGEGACTFDVEVTWTHRGTGTLEPGDLWIGLFDEVEPPGGMFAFYENTERVYARVEGDLWYGAWTEPDDGALHEPEPVEGAGTDWIAIADRYFGIFAIPADRTGSTSWARWGAGEDAQDGVIWSPPVSLEPGASHTSSFRVYAGQNDTETLAEVDETLTDIIDFGIFAVFCYPLLFLLQFIEGFTGNWGVAIVILTVMVRVAFFPLNQSAFKSAEKMKVVQPLMNEIREKYKDDAEALNRATVDLFKEHKVNPVGGCLPMFIQMPVFLALFYVLMYSADLYHTEFLYLRDLSSPDPYCVLPTVVVVLMLVQQQFTPMGNMDPAQARMMKMMPLMFGIFWFMFPSGLVVYYFVNTALGILQQWWIRRTFAANTPTPTPAA